jgi:2-dehydro-3-deoxyphosphogluconate aldolase/(4S)-4-hydroxy-2-oxoglutarate aldolase
MQDGGLRLNHQDGPMPASERLIQSLRSQPVLIVLRPPEPLAAWPLLERLEALGLRHVEIAWQPLQDWAAQMAQLIRRFPRLELGAASVCRAQAVADAAAAGCRYAVSPVLDPLLLQQAADGGLVLVPGVFSPSEVHQARLLGCALVKLFPAVSAGLHYWRRLSEPLGGGLPFCIAAGGLKTEDLAPWLQAGVDAVALGSAVSEPAAAQRPGEPDRWQAVLQALPDRDAPVAWATPATANGQEGSSGIPTPAAHPQRWSAE